MIKVAVGIIMHHQRAHDPLAHDLNRGLVDRVLLCQRKKNARYGLKWEFPGGKVEDGENVPDCLRRELREELNISAVIGELFHKQHYVYPDSGAYDVAYHLVPLYSGEIVNRVFESCAWVPVADLNSYDILEGNMDVVQKLKTNNGKILLEKH